MTDHPELSFELLRQWARESLEEVATEPAARSALAQRETAAWPLLVEAAVVNAFLPRQLAPQASIDLPREEVERTVLDFAETMRDPKGMRWSLTHAARVEVLGAAHGTPELEAALRHAADSPYFAADPVNRALHECLTRGRAAAEHDDLESLEATRIAAVTLTGVPGVELPELDDLDREIEFRRLMGQFQRMVGQRPSGDSAERRQYFFGRAAELEQLRGYVGVIEADTTFQAVKRGIASLQRVIQGRAPLAVWGVGGAGKTTLISKFMLEHAEAAVTRFPFTYLDFDRITVSARQKSMLLAEMCLQTGAQFKELSKPMADLRARAQQLGGSFEAAGELESISSFVPLMQDFRRLVEDHLNTLEGAWSLGRRPFLLVFDTFEVVQYREDGVRELEDFVKGFSLPGESGMWPRLRLIVSGRKKVDEFIMKVEELPIGTLDPHGSAELLEALANDFGKSITRRNAESLVTAVIKASGERGGVQPLRLRLIGEAFRNSKTQEDGPAIARSLVKELGQPLHAEGRAAQILIDGILVRRVLGHVNDPRVAALTDPGLVVRYITPDVIRHVMTPTTARPKAQGTNDTDVAEPWLVDEQEAEDIFRAFRKEVTLVEPEGKALRHRPDVRQQMLGLIQARCPEQFAALHGRAFDYFRRLAELDPNDYAAAAEAVYHGLWLGESLEELNRLWPGRDDFDTKIDPAEFAQGSPANVFVRAKMKAALEAQEVSILPRKVALEWLDKRSDLLLKERRVQSAIEVIQVAAGQDYEALNERPATAATLARLLYRAGLWNDAAMLARRHLREKGLDKSHDEALFSLKRTLATIVGKSGASLKAFEALDIPMSSGDPLVCVDVNAHAAAALVRNRPGWSSQLERIVTNITEAARGVKMGRWRQERRVLHLAILTVGDPGTEDMLLKHWLRLCERLPRSIERNDLKRMLSYILIDKSAQAKANHLLERAESERPDELRSQLDELWRAEKKSVLKSLDSRTVIWPDTRRALRTLIGCDHFDWARPLGNALTRALTREYDVTLVDMLYKESFLTGVMEKQGFFSRSISQRRRQDGVAIVQLAEDSGRLLELASLLERGHSTEWKAGEKLPACPQDVFALGSALLNWHDTLNKHFVLRKLSPDDSLPDWRPRH